MIPRCEPLPTRLLPTPWLAIPGTSATVRYEANDLGITDGAGGWAREMGPVFEGRYAGGLSVSLAGDAVVVGAMAPGGPRCVLLDLDTGDEMLSVFVGDPESRQGCDAGAIAELIAAVQGVPVTVHEPAVAWEPSLPYSQGWGPVRVELVPAGWVGTDNEFAGLVYDVFDEIWDRGGVGYEYTVGSGLKSPGIYVRLLPGMTAADVAEEVLGW